jgi:hypothetical protein
LSRVPLVTELLRGEDEFSVAVGYPKCIPPTDN